MLALSPLCAIVPSPLFYLVGCDGLIEFQRPHEVPVGFVSHLPSSATPPCTSTAASDFGFTYPPREPQRIATSVPVPTRTSTYAAGCRTALDRLARSLSTTTWDSWNPTVTATATDSANPYGKFAWTALWERANPPNFTAYTSVYSSTVSPTPIPTSELILPPADYFGPTDTHRSFPEHFVFGVAGSAAQIEGATAQEGKSPSLADILIQDDRPKDYVTNENYFYYKQDIERLAALGVKYYSFSIAWTRILPFALPGTPLNQHGIQHYDDLINFVLEKGMQPIVTLLHFDTPLQFYGNISTAFDKPLIGFFNGAYQNATFEEAFVNYASVVMTHYADRVPVWVTINEPLLFSFNGRAVSNVIKAHARIYHFYKHTLAGWGKVGIKFSDNPGVPLDPDDPDDVYAADHYNEFNLATFANPIYLGTDYPQAFKDTIRDYVPLSAADLGYIGGTADFFGVDIYTAVLITTPSVRTPGQSARAAIAACARNTSSPLFPYCVTQTEITSDGWNIGYHSQSYVYTTPTYLRSHLRQLWHRFRTPLFLTEFGFPVFAESQSPLIQDQLFDSPRSVYYLSNLSELLRAIWDDGTPVLGALAWSFADNWEFGDYAPHFGLQTVNRTTQERKYKKSFFDVVQFVNERIRGEGRSRS